MRKLFGLVVCGGQSSRMGEDKSLLCYHGKPQRYHLYDLLQPFCEKVFISCSKQQADSVQPQYEMIVDEEKYSNTGPMGALLNAFEKHPSASFLVLGCDYPFIRKKNIRDLVEAGVGMESAICYCNPITRICEPLFSIYEQDAYKPLLENFNMKKYSLRHFLNETSVCMIVPDEIDFLRSVDDIDSYHRAKEIIIAKLN